MDGNAFMTGNLNQGFVWGTDESNFTLAIGSAGPRVAARQFNMDSNRVYTSANEFRTKNRLIRLYKRIG